MSDDNDIGYILSFLNHNQNAQIALQVIPSNNLSSMGRFRRSLVRGRGFMERNGDNILNVVTATAVIMERATAQRNSHNNYRENQLY